MHTVLVVVVGESTVAVVVVRTWAVEERSLDVEHRWERHFAVVEEGKILEVAVILR